MTAVPGIAYDIEVSFAGHYVLPLLHRLHRPDLVSVFSGQLIVHGIGGSHHLLFQFLHQFRTFSFEKVAHCTYVGVIVFPGTEVEAGTCAEMKMVLEAGPGNFHGAAVSDGIIAPQEAQGGAKASHIGKGAEIAGAVIMADISCHKNAGPFFVGCDFHIGIGLIIPEGNIVFWMDFLDEVAFQNQGFHFRGSHGNVQIFRMADHGGYLRGAVLIFPYIRADTIFKIFSFAHIDNPPIPIFPPIHAGRVRQGFYFGPDFIVYVNHFHGLSSLPWLFP